MAVVPAAPAAPATPAVPAAPAPVVRFAEGLSTPESVLYDEANDVYLVSNINGNPAAADNNGYISKLSPDGKVIEAKWIEGGKNKVSLDAPKGSAIVGSEFWVADITQVRRFDLKTGAPKGNIAIKDATFLNDLVGDGHDGAYVSDTGVKVGANGFEPTGTDAVWHIDAKHKATVVAKSTGLKRPNGLAKTADGVWVVPFGSNTGYLLDTNQKNLGKQLNTIVMPKGALDGLIALPNDEFLVSSWEGSAIYRGKAGGTFTEVFGNQTSPADIGYDSKRKRILIPQFSNSVIEVFELPN